MGVGFETGIEDLSLFQEKDEDMDDTNGGQKPSRIGGVDIYDCREIDAADLSGYENAIWDLFKRKYDCLIVCEGHSTRRLVSVSQRERPNCRQLSVQV